MNNNGSVSAGVSLAGGNESARRHQQQQQQRPRDLSARSLTRRAAPARTALLLLACAVVFACASARAATLPAGFAETAVATGLSSPTAMAFAPDGRVFVCLQGGQLRVVKNGALLPTPFHTVTVNSIGERGLLGLAFDPDFATNRFIYLYYTATTPAVHNRISRFRASASNPDVVEAGSETVLLDLENLSASNHNGGAMHFGADGKLYVAVGENAVPSNSQTLANKLGKMLRLNSDGSIPADNPFFAAATGTNRAIWAMGLRNPFTFNVQPGTGRIFVNDVGQNAIEEINDGLAGQNYGWPTCEGLCPTASPVPTPAVRPPNSFTDPVFLYSNDASTCAITGGTFYNPTTQQFPAEYAGKYFYSDFCAGWIRRYDPAADTSTNFATATSSPVDLQVSTDGSLWYLERGNTGRLLRIRYTAGVVPPSITGHPQSQTVAAGQSVTFSVAATGSTPLQYQWQRNNVDIPGATSASYTFTAAAGDNGAQFRAVVTNAFGSATSNAATLTVSTNSAPAATISAPAAGTTYAAGDTINYSGTGTDPEDGAIPASGLTWQVDFHHDTHSHPFVAPTTGASSGSFVIPTTGETAANVFYRIYLTVTDSAGATNQTFRDITPRTATVTLRTEPAGLQLTLDGQPHPDGYAELNVVNMSRTLGAPSPQELNGVTYQFVSWSDGGAATHAVNVPAGGATYTARFARRAGAGDVIVSEYRLDGPNGPTDEFVELYNDTDQSITVSTGDGSAGWALVRGRDVSGSPALETYHVIPNGTVIPARAHYLVTGAAYGLADYGGANAAAGDAAAASGDLGGDGSPFRGLALFRTANPANFAAAERLDAAGCPTLSHALLVEGAGAGPCANVGTPAQPAAHYSLARKLDGGTPQDTDDNAADFRLVAVDSPLASPSTGGTLASALGAPGPENLSSPLPRANLKAALLDPQAASSSAPNRARDTTPHACAGGAGPSNCAAGTLSIRRRFTNSTGAAVTRLRFRVLQLTTLGALAPGDADLRVLSSGNVVVSVTGGTASVRGTTLEQPPAQSLGGGFNSTLAAGTVSLATPLAAGNSINVQFVLGVQQTGNFRFFVNVEAALDSPPAAPDKATRAGERDAGRKTLR